MHVIIHTDGGARGNPGPSASAFTVHSPQNEIIQEDSRFIGTATNNVAEYTALLMSFEWLSMSVSHQGITEVDVLMDSELIVKQMRGEYRIKDATLQSFAARIKTIEKSLGLPIHFIHIPRAQNARADELVNAALDAQITH